ncbi:MAG: ATP-binding protein [Kocuria palustris]|nr:ATP-binding protein [Kocuria palustris]
MTAKPFTRKHPLELVIFCGSPGAGKSTFYWNHLEPLGYERVNQDILKTVRVINISE